MADNKTWVFTEKRSHTLQFKKYMRCTDRNDTEKYLLLHRSITVDIDARVYVISAKR